MALKWNHEYWWRTCKPALEGLFDFANSYTEGEKEEHLQWFAQNVIPWFGRPHSSETGISLTRDKSPLEVSLNLTTHGVARVRFGMQVVGVDMDAFDVPSEIKLLQPFLDTASDLDMRWFQSASQILVCNDADEIARAKAATPPGMKMQPPTLGLAFDLEGPKRKLKTYLFPLVKSWATNVSSELLTGRAIRGLSPRGNELAGAMGLLERYLAEDCPEQMLLVMIGLDSVDPTVGTPRAKVYGNVYTSNSWNVVSNVYTLGGKVTDPERIEGLERLKSVWHLLLSEKEPLPVEYSKPLRDVTSPHGAFTTSFEMKPRCVAPDVKIYISVWQYGKDDFDIATNLIAALRLLGFHREADGYFDFLKRTL